MARIVGVHGIANYAYFAAHRSADAAAETISADWTAWMARDPADTVVVSYYAHLLHRGAAQGGDDVRFLDPAEQRLLTEVVDLIRGPQGTPQGAATARAREAAEWLTERHGRAARRLVVTFVQEVAAYLHIPGDSRRVRARDAVAATVRARRPTVLIAHSLGTVVAYEALWAHPDLSVDLLITLGSPLGMNEVVYQRLTPAPSGARHGRPPGVRRWINIADIGDLVAVPADLSRRFEGVEQHGPLRMPGFDFHRVKSYLACPEVRDLI